MKRALVGVLGLVLVVASVAMFGWNRPSSTEAFQNAGYPSVTNYEGTWWSGSSGWRVVQWCYDTEYSVWGGEDAYVYAATAWNNSQSYIVLQKVSCQYPVVNRCNHYQNDGENSVGYVNGTLGSAGLACLNFDGTTGQINEADILLDYDQINGSGVPFSAIALHEFGHLLGLNHSTAQNDASVGLGAPTCLPFPSTPDAMCPYALINMYTTYPQTDDINGLEFIYHDSDGDKCTGMEEYGQYASLGGTRSDENWYDFYDVPVPFYADGPLTVPDGVITAADAQAVMAAFRAGWTSNDPVYWADRNGNGRADGLEYDRSPAPDPNKPHAVGPPNGVVSAADAQLAFASSSDNCLQRGP